ncbi:outer membrane autotransporter protein [Luteibacter sp. Sphag1AF]|uniref:autotransporter family protein n=1 Tax=Luteibacter sp. Sphag1AF TaxID=2587031 RepID=UPI001617A76B|nr:autotransporter outer membrane beta-barrel domain-containing protein [Luteibacter sp. Sphag1AF]MBB3228271.1 outer membrane autotransporter protein [Luteibacter sp. Sphag1AF]
MSIINTQARSLPRDKRYRKAVLSAHIALACAVAGPAMAAIEVIDGQSVYAGNGRSYLVVNKGTLIYEQFTTTGEATLQDSHLDMSAGGTITGANGVLMFAGSTATLNGANVTASNNAAMILEDSSASITNSTLTSTDRAALVVQSIVADASQITASATVADSTIVGAGSGIETTKGAQVHLSNTYVEGTTGGTNNLPGYGAFLRGGSTTITTQSNVVGAADGIAIEADPNSTDLTHTDLIIDNSRVEGRDGSAILVTRYNDNDSPVSATISVANGASLVASNGTLLDVSNGSVANFTVDNSSLSGNIVADATSTADVTLQNSATLTGQLSGVRNLGVGSNSVLTLTDSTSISSLSLDGGTVQFAPGMNRALNVAGDFAGSGGVVGLHTELSSGGLLSNQNTDRLLIEGNVTTTGTTLLDVTPTGAGALTDLNENGIIEAHEGISLVQVAGTSRADAFALRGGYVAAGPWQYVLQAFGPGETDPAQNLLTGGLNWDYRIGNKYVCENGCEGEGEGEGPGPGPGPDPCEEDGTCAGPGPGPEPGERPAVVPQVPSYIVAPTALLSYGNLMVDSLHQRLGDIRGSKPDDGLGGEVFARVLGGQQRYTSNVGFTHFGYDFDQQSNALQVGGSVLAAVGDSGTLRAGWALDNGTTRVTPKAADGASRARYTSNGVSAWITWQADNGWYVDGVLSGSRYSGNISTDLRGSDVAKVRASGRIISVEAGRPFAIGTNWTLEPQVQVQQQTLSFDNFRDVDGLDVKLGDTSQTSVRAGALLTYSESPKFAPYLRVDLTRTFGGDTQVNVASTQWGVQDQFTSGKAGSGYRVGAGITSKITSRLSLYGEGNYQGQLGGFGARGWSANMGLRYSF